MSGTYCVTAQPGDIITVINETGEEQTRYVVPKKEDFLNKDLIGIAITVTDAAKKYNVNRFTILTWKNRGLIKTIKDGYRAEIDEADMAYCAKIYHDRQQAGIRYGAPLLNEDGQPYMLKHPQLSEYRRKKATA